MKKLTPRFKKWLERRSRKKLNKSEPRARRYSCMVNVWAGEEFEDMLCTSPPKVAPSVLCFNDNSINTLEFFGYMRRKLRFYGGHPSRGWGIKRGRRGKIPRIKGYIDFSAINVVSTPAALVLAAEYDRLRRLAKSPPATVNLHEWKPGVFKKLYELGFFDIVGLSERVEKYHVPESDVLTMRIITGSNATELQKASESLEELSSFLGDRALLGDGIRNALASAISEGMVNVARHAYPSDYQFQYTHVNAWWMTASANRSTKRLTVVLFDQGASIPVTLQKKPLTLRMADFIKRNILFERTFEYQDDATYIEGAMAIGATQTREAGRGYGLPQMKDLIDLCGAGALTILSRGGAYRYIVGVDPEKVTYHQSVGGTLIVWELDLSRAEHGER